MIVIIGSGRHAGVVEDSLSKKKIKYLNLSKKYNLSSDKKLEKIISKNKKNYRLHIAIGDNKLREKIYNLFKKKRYKFQNVIDTSSIVSKNVQLGHGNYVGPGVIINTKAKIDNNCIINSGSIIEHDVKVKSYTHLAPGSKVMGSTVIGKRCFIGAGVILNNKLKICDDCVIGSGSVVINNLNKKGLYVGIPAKRKKK
tara:strand:- start:1330 stop:1923 length:594 start_codon:yes stop_codon:yes gene_type:complete